MMRPRSKLVRIPKLVALLLALLLVATAVYPESGAVAALQTETSAPPVGVVCTTNPSGTFNLTTREGYIAQPDGNVVYMWGFSEGENRFQHPGPVLCVNEGDTVTIVLHNTLREDVSIVFPGQSNVLANGALSQPQFNAAGEMTSLAPVAAANGGSVTYSFVADHPGTFIYESGTEPAKQIDMGLFGVIIVRPAMNVYDAAGNLVEAYAYNDPGSRYKPETEYLIIVSEIDPEMHMATEQGYRYNMNEHTPRYWMYNGRGFPDTLADNGAAWLPDQPYGTLVYMHPYDDNPTLEDGSPNPAYNPYPVLVRYASVGLRDYSHHPHGNHGRVIGRDGHLLSYTDAGSPDPMDMSYEKFTITIGPGQTLDALYNWTDVEKWHPTDNPIPVVIPQLQDLTVGQWYSGSPYLGNLEALPVGTQAFNQCGEYYHLAHNHGLHQITAWGVVLSGQITFSRIDPPLPNDCP